MSEPEPAAAPRRGLQGHLRLVAAVDEQGRTHLRSQSFRVPAHLGKPFTDQGVLVANIVNPTAGLLAGDRVDVDVRVEKGARLLLTTPAATRLHTMKEGCAAVRQIFTVADEAWLEISPDFLIPQARARYEQTTEIRVAPGGELLYFELLAPGRVASGEAFAFDHLQWKTDIFFDGHLIARERFSLSPATASLHALQTAFPAAYLATCFVISGLLKNDSPCWTQLENLHDENTWIGFSRLTRGGWAVKALTRDSVSLRKSVAAIRRALYSSANWQLPALRRT